MKNLDPDPVITEIREARHLISSRFGHDPRRLVAHYIQQQEQHPGRLIGDNNASPGSEPSRTSDGTVPVAQSDGTQD